MRTIHVYVPSTERDRYYSPDSDGRFLISAMAKDVPSLAWMNVRGSIPGAKSVVAEFCLRAVHGEKGLGIWLCAWPLHVETLRRCGQASMRATHKSAACAAAARHLPSPHMHFFDILIHRLLECAHLWFCLCAYTNTRCTREAAVSPPLCGDCNRRSEGFPWVSGRVGPYLN